MADNALVFKVGQTSTGTPTPRGADGTPSGGTVSNLTLDFSNVFVNFTMNPDGTVTFIAVDVTPPLTGSFSCTVVDTDGAVSTWNESFTVEVQAGPPPAQLTQSVAMVFSAPV